MRNLSNVVRFNIFSILVSLLVSVQIIQPTQLNAVPTQGSIRTNLNAGVQFATQNTALTTSFTIEAWWKWADGASVSEPQLLLGGSGTPGIYTFGNNSLKLTRWGGGYDSPSCSLQNSFVTGSWYHLAIGRSSGGLVTVWLNGSPLQNCSKLTVAAFAAGTQFPSLLGGNSAGTLFDGYFANYRATSTDIYGAADALGFQPNSNFYTAIPGTINLLNTPNDSASVFSDSIGSPSGFTSHSGGTLSSEFPTYTPQSICFNGTQSKYFNTEQIGTGDFTAELWVKPTANVQYESFLDLGLNNGGAYLGYVGGDSNRIMFYDSGVDSAYTTVPLNSWTHVAIVRSSNVLKMYIAGQLISTATNHTKNYSYDRVYFGSYNKSVANYKGCMASVRVVKSAVYLAPFTPASVGSFVALPNATAPLVSLTAAGGALYNSGTAGSVQGTGTLTYEALQIPQSILTMNAASGTYGSTTTLGTTGGSGTGAVSYTVVSGNCSVSGDVLSSTSAGNCVLTATKAADATYNAITSAQVTVAIAKKTQVFPFSISSSTGSFTYGATYTVSMTFPAEAVAGVGTWNVLKASTAYGVNAPGDQVCTGAAVTAAGTYTCSFNSANMYPTAQAIAISGLYVRFTGSNNYNAFSHTTDGTKISIIGCDYVFCANSNSVTVTATNKTINFGTDLGGAGFETPYGDSGGQLRYTISNGASGATKAWGVSCTSTYTTGAAVGTYPIICTSTTRPTGAPTPITDDWVAQNTNFPNLYNANVDNALYTLKNPANSQGICSSAAQWWIKCSFYTSDTYSNLTFVNGVLTVQKATLSAPGTPTLSAVPGSPSSISAAFTSVTGAASHTAKVYATNGTTLLQTINNYTSGTTISGLTATTNYKVSIIAIGDGVNTNSSAESTKGSVTTNAKSTSRTIIFPTTSYSLNYGDTQTVSATVSARANIPTITFSGNNLTNTNPRLTTGVNGNQGANGNFFGYALEQGSFTEGQIVTMSDLRAGSTVTYSGKLHFLYAGGFGWAFYITDILSVTGSSVNTTSSNWLLTGEGAITYSAGASTACSVDQWTGIVTVTSGTGTCAISSTVVEDSEYLAMTTTTPVSITVNKIAQSEATLSLNASSKSAPYSQALTMTSGGGNGTGAKTYAILAGGTASGCALANSSASNTLTATSAGTCLIQATKAADSNYTVGVSAAQTFTFVTSDQAVALSVTSTSGTYGTDLNLTSSGGSGTGAVTFATSTAGCSLPTTTTLRAAGAIACQVTATKAADADYNAVSSTLTNVVFAAKNLTISGLTGVNKVFDAGISSVIATGTPALVGVVGADEVTLLGTPIFTFADAAVADNKVVSATGYGLTGAKAANYTLTQPSVTANITKKSATLTATSSTVVVGNSYTPAFTYSGLAGSDSITAVTYNYSATGTGTAPTTVGTSTITPSAAVFGVGSINNYNLSYINGTLEIVTMYQVSFKSNFTSSDTTTATVNYVPGDTPITPQTPTRNNFTFLGWYTSAIGGTKVTGAITPIADTVYWAQWIQNSLNGMGAATSIGTFTTDVNYADTFTRSGAYGTVTVAIPAGALPNATSVSIYQVTDPTRANSLLAGSTYVLSLVVAWLTPAATVPSTVAGKPVTMTITNATIKQGAKIYAIVNDVVTLLGTAAQDGSAQVLITDDPEVVVVFTKPDAPTGVSATNGSNASSVVSWSAPASNGGSAITGYKVTANSGQECTSVTTTCSFTGLTNGTSYTFTVNAINAIGISDTSTASVAITPSAPAPASAPISVQMPAPLPAPVSLPVAPVIAVVPTITSLKFAENATKDGGKLTWVGTNIESVLFTGDLNTYPAPYNYGAFTLTWSGELVNIVRGKTYTAKLEARSATGGSATETVTYSIPLTAEDLAAAKAIVDAKAAEEAAALKAAQDKADAIAKAKAQELAEKLAAEEKAIAEAKAATDKAAADAAIAAALKVAKELADAEARVAAELKAVQDKAAEDARIAEELRIATELAEANLKIAAEKKALEDAAAAAALAAKKIVPKITLYSISSKLTLSAYDKAYLNKYISTLKSKAIVTCIGYYYQKNTTLTKAKALAKLQADAICKMIKKAKPSVITKIVLYSSTKAPKAAQGAKWVAISYRVDSFKTK
jgi:hypothetical protein